MQVVQFANSLIDARNELQHKYVQIYSKARRIFFSLFWSPSPPAHVGVLMETCFALETCLSTFYNYASMIVVIHLFILEISRLVGTWKGLVRNS